MKEAQFLASVVELGGSVGIDVFGFDAGSKEALKRMFDLFCGFSGGWERLNPAGFAVKYDTADGVAGA